MTDTALLLKKVEGLPPGYMARILEFIDQLTQKAPAERKREAEASPSQIMFDEAARALGYKDDLDYLAANSPATIEEAKAEAARKRKNRPSIYEFYGCLKGEDCYGDGMEYQRMMRDEWAHRP
jgi:hypothetical protein